MAITSLSTALDPAELPTTIRRMAGIVGWKMWQKRIDGLHAELNSNPLWRQFVLERYGLELAFADVHRHLRATGRCPWPPEIAEQYRLYSFLAAAVRVHARLSPEGRARLAGAIRTGLKKEFGLGPVAFEMKVVAHLMSRGFDIEFHDLASGGGYDFLATSGPKKIEVECKHISADIGRQIHRSALHDLGGVLRPAMTRAVDKRHDGQLLQITLPGKLTRNKDHQQMFAKLIESVLSGKSPGVNDSVCAVSAQSFSLETSPFSGEHINQLTLQDIEHYLKRAFNIENSHILTHWRPGHGAVLIVFKSAKPDSVLGEIFKHLKADAKKQFSANLPAFLCVHLADLTEAQLRDLADTERAGTVTGLQCMVSTILQKRPHVHSIAVMAHGEVRITQERSHDHIQTCVQETGPSYVFRNSKHPMAQNSVLDRVFV
jgi:hypothetical protein